MNSKQLVKNSLNHMATERTPVDFGSTGVTGIHINVVEKLRKHYGIHHDPVKVIEPYQMLGEIEPDLAELMGIDTIGIHPRNNLFGFSNNDWKPFKTFWGQEVMVPKSFNTTFAENGDLLMYPEGDTNAPASAKMPSSSYFFDSIIRQVPYDEDKLMEYNMEEFKLFEDEDITYLKKQAETVKNTDKAVIANFGGTGLGDIALVPAPFMKHPKGIRDIADWYMSTLMRSELVANIFDRQTDIAIKNLESAFAIFGNSVDVIYVCGTDFGTQTSTFCAPETFDEIWLPYYKKMNDWIHKNTSWKTFKHSCGAVEGFMKNFIAAGFDIINPVQINATGMDPVSLKQKYGNQLTFWGGGIDTQKVLGFGTKQEVKDQVKRQIEIFGKNGGFIFNAVHNIQANVPVENVVTMIDTIKEMNKN